MIDTTRECSELWPSDADAPWRVLAWPDWTDGDLERIFHEFGPSLAEARACLCLRHDPMVDPPSETALARLQTVAASAKADGIHIPVVLADGARAEGSWEHLGAAVHAKIKTSRGASSPASPRQAWLNRVRAFELRTAGDVARLLVASPTARPLDQFRRLFADVPGWFFLPSIGIWDCLLTHQFRAGVRGNFLEIGVWKGRSALLSTLHSSEGEECVFVDVMSLDEARAKLETVRDSGLHFIQGNSRNLVAAMLPGSAPPAYRWIHIDGEHSGIAVEHDLTLASGLLGERGIIVVDDFFSPSYPQITFAVIDHLRAHPKSLMIFLCGFNKAYLCHPSDGRWLLQYVAEEMATDLTARGVPPSTLFKTTDPLDLNCFGIGPRGPNDVFRGPDWALDLLLY